MEAVILAGGFGKRLRSVVSDVPKPMADMDGRPFLSYLIEYLSGRGVKRVFLSVGYMHETVTGYFGKSYAGADIEYIIEREPLGTGGAMAEALGHTTEENIIVLNGDTFFAIDPIELLRFHEAKGAHLTMALKPVPDTERYGAVAVEGERVVGFKEKSFSGQGCINAGAYAVNRTLSGFLGGYGRAFSFEVDFLPENITKLRLFAFIRDGYFIDIGVPEDYERAKKELRAVFKGESEE